MSVETGRHRKYTEREQRQRGKQAEFLIKPHQHGTRINYVCHRNSFNQCLLPEAANVTDLSIRGLSSLVQKDILNSLPPFQWSVWVVVVT